jgi:1-acyl-sn-glycerol-3-phosphate acyltransferase
MALQAQVSDVLNRAAGVIDEYAQQVDPLQVVETLSYWLGRAMVDAYTRWVLGLDVVWRAPLPQGPKIVAANHPTTTDPFYMLAVIPEQMSILITDMAFAVPGFGRYLRAAGHIPVIQNKGHLAFEQARQLLQAGRTVGIFVEGTLSPLSDALGFHEARTGAVRLALSTGAPIVPVGISLDPKRIRFSMAQAGGRSEIARWYLGGPYVVTAGAAMTCTGSVDDRDHVRAESQHVMRRIARLSQASAQRLDRCPCSADALPGRFRRRGAAQGI